MMNFNNSSALPFVGMGLQPPPAAAMAMQPPQQPEITMEDVQRFISSKLLNQAQQQQPSLPMPSHFNPINSPNHLADLSNQFHQMQHQIELSRQHNEMTTLMHLQQQLQQLQAHNSNHLAFASEHQTFTVPTLPQHGYKSEMRSSHASINPISVAGGDTRSSHGSIASEALLKIWKEDQEQQQANKNGLTSQKLQEHNAHQDGENKVSRSISTDEIMLVPTKDPSPTSFTKSNESETTSSLANAEFKRCRSNSTSSFDALLSAVGDDLVQLDKKKQEEEKKSSGGATDADSNVSKAHDLQHHLTEIFGQAEAAKATTATSARASLEMTPGIAAIREMAEQQFTSGVNPLMLAHHQGLQNIAQGTSTGTITTQELSRQMKRISSSDTSNCAIEMAIKRLSSALTENPYVSEGTTEEQPQDDPRKDLESFLSEYGEAAKNSQESMLSAISDSESSLAKIHEWDRNMGHRKCSNRTVVKTRRSRAKIKAFLMGVRPPKEPKSRKKKRKVLV